ncbi:hypothetical protein BDV3_003663 [Batrachochytrium dendrobatidis]|nr:positive regulation of nitrogen compound metabolic process [Batrachochytrium dendrobatidis]
MMSYSASAGEFTVQDNATQSSTAGSSLQMAMSDPHRTEKEGSDSSEDESPEISQKQMVVTAKYISSLDPELVNRKVCELVRFALFMESSRTPIRRKDIITKVLKEYSKGFPIFVQRAREMLQHLFGMDMVVLPTKRFRRNRKPGPTASQGSSTTNSWMLKSILTEKQRTTALTIRSLDAQHMTLLTIILAFIHANSRSMREGTLYMHLKELGIDRNTTHPVFGSIEAELKQYTKLGYLETSKIRTGEGETNNYIWGSRAIVEFSESMIVRFITEMYPRLDDAGRRRLAIDVERNAGSV